MINLTATLQAKYYILECIFNFSEFIYLRWNSVGVVLYLPIATIAIDDKKTGTSLHERDN